VVPNVEQYEARFPLLYLWRRREPDTGGAGRWRGGSGVGYAVTPRGVDVIGTVSPHFSGTITPESPGRLRLTVRNTGAPLHTAAPRFAGDHVGIDNIRRRLAGHYGEDASLLLTADGGGNTVAEIVLPLVDQSIALEEPHDVEAVAGRPR